MIQNMEQLQIELSGLTNIPEGYRIIKNTSDSLVIRTKDGTHPLHFYKMKNTIGSNDPIFPNHMQDTLIVLGLHNNIRNVIEKCQADVTIYIYELDIHLIQLVFDHTDYKELFNRENVVFSFVKEKRYLLDEISSIYYNKNAVFYFSDDNRTLYTDLMNDVFLRLYQDQASHMQFISSKDKYALILDYKNGTSYSALSYFAEQFKQSFQMLNLKTTTFEYHEDAGIWFYKDRLNLLNLNISFIFTMNGRILYPNGRYEFNFLNKPTIFYFLDNPVHHYPRARYNIPQGICLWVDQNHVEFARTYLPKMRHERLLHCGNNVLFKHENALFDKDRSIPVLFNGSLNYCKYEEYLNQLNPQDKVFFPKLLEDYLTKDLSIETSIEHSLLNLGLDLDKENFMELISHFSKLILLYIRSLKRYVAMKYMLDANIKVICYGYGWDKTDLFHHPNFISRPVSDYSEQYQIYLDTKIVINILPELKDGLHDRILSSMVAGALCISEKSKILCEEFQDGEDIAFFDFSHIEQLPQIINKYLNDDEKRIQITKKAYEKVKNKHTFLHRAKEILELLDIEIVK